MDFRFQQHISRLVLRYLEGTLETEEQKELETWRSASVDHEKMFRQMISASYFDANYKRFVKNDVDAQAEWEAIRKRTLGGYHSLGRNVWRYAALWIIPLMVGGGIFYGLHRFQQQPERVVTAFIPGSSHAVLELSDGTYVDLKETARHAISQGANWKITADSLEYQALDDRKKPEYHRLRIPRGGEYTLILADGTKVFLNAESSLKYPVAFQGDCRKVSLEGEAYFEVRRDTCHPFVVEINQMEVTVLGTSFGIRAYTSEANVLTTLVSGKVCVASGTREFILKPQEQAVYDKATREVEVTAVDPELFVGWKDGRLIFDNCPLEHILNDLGRWYSFDVFYTGQAAKKIPFSLNIRKHEKFSQVLELIENTGKVKFEINKNTVIVK